MKYARKMRLVPADQPTVLTVKPYEPQYVRNPVKGALENLSQDMQNLLQNETLTEDQKMQQYGQLFLRYQTMQKKLKEPVALPVPETKEITEPPKSILESVPKTYRNKAQLLLNHIKEKTDMSWDDENRLVKNGKSVPGTNILDIVNDLVRERKTMPHAPRGWYDVLMSLKDTNVPREAIGNESRWKAVSTPENVPSPPRKSRIPRRRTLSITRIPRWLSMDDL